MPKVMLSFRVRQTQDEWGKNLQSIMKKGSCDFWHYANPQKSNQILEQHERPQKLSCLNQ